jgi:hypothetical protein
MFEKSLKDFLAGDPNITGLISSFEGAPAIFTSAAPQKAVLPYIVFDINKFAPENLAASAFSVALDLYAYNESAKDLRQLATYIEYRCDRKILPETDPRFGHIRLFYEDGREVENSDVKIKHYVVTLSARAGRKQWAAL